MNKNNFVEAMDQRVAWKLTENGLDARSTTFDNCLDLFATIGALRKRTEREVENKIMRAYNESALVTMKILFYARDIEEGLGERNVFRIGLRWLALNRTDNVIVNIHNIVKFGRWDDLYCLFNTPAESYACEFIQKQLNEDMFNYGAGKPISLMAKWLKSVNTSSEESNRLGRRTAIALGLTEREYRKTLSMLRKYINIVEKTISAKRWEDVNYNSVPGGAMKKYYGAFFKHDGERFQEYVDALKSGKKIMVEGVEVEAKINTKNLYPYEILERASHGHFWLDSYREVDPMIEAMWDNLKDWVGDTEANMIIIADTSGSMSGRPMATSVGLGIYFAERNKGAYHNKFMTFSSTPSWITIPEGGTLADKLSVVPDIVSNTNLQKAFNLILDTAIWYSVPKEEMPKSLVIITDMEFDSCVEDNSHRGHATNMDFYDRMKETFESYGYDLPEVVFWNVDARQDTYHSTAHRKGVRMVSGQATSIFKSLIDGKTHSPYEFMLEVVFSDRYDSVTI